MEVLRRWIHADETVQVEASTVRVVKIQRGQVLVEVLSPGPIATGQFREEPNENQRDIDDLN